HTSFVSVGANQHVLALEFVSVFGQPSITKWIRCRNDLSTIFCQPTKSVECVAVGFTFSDDHPLRRDHFWQIEQVVFDAPHLLFCPTNRRFVILDFNPDSTSRVLTAPKLWNT